MKGWHQLQAQEQRILILGAVALSAILFYALIWEPLSLERQQLTQQVQTQRDTYQWMQNAAQDIKALQAQRPAATALVQTSLLAVIDQSLRSSALRSISKRIEPKGENQVRVDFSAVTFNDLITWLAQLHQQHSINISHLNIERLAQNGQVKAYVRLERAA